MKIKEHISDAIYGLNDGLGSIFGMIAGVAGFSTNNTYILISGIFGALAACMSMGAGAYQATQSSNKIENENKSKMASALSGGISTFVGGIIPLIPFLFLHGLFALIIAAITSFIVQFIAGSLKSIFTKEIWWKSGLSMMLIGMIVGVSGFVFGKLGQYLIH